MSRLENTVALLGELVAFPSVSSETNLPILHHIADYLAPLGARIELLPDESGQKANLWASFGPDLAEGGTVLSAHVDVVPVEGQDWASDPFVLREEGGRLYGRGTCDMKGFIAAVLAMAPEFASLPLVRPLHIALTHDEEVGCVGAAALTRALHARGLRPAMALIGEPTEMAVIDAHKGCNEYTVQFTGRAGHGSNPAAGVNAAEYAVRYATRLIELRAELAARAPAASPFAPPATTINIGRIAGGQMHNVIAEHASLAWEMRPVCPEDEAFVKAEIALLCETELLPAMRAVAPEAAIETGIEGEVAGLQRRAHNPMRDLLLSLTGANAAGTVPFGTEAGLFANMGAATVVCGPGSIAQAHTADEFITRDQLAACLALLERLGATLSRPG